MTDEQCRQHLICWMFRNAQKSWNKTPLETKEVFIKYDLYKFLYEAYDWMHLESYDNAFKDLNSYLKIKGENINA